MQHSVALNAAQVLVQARRSKVRLQALAANLIPANQTDGYQIQDLVVTCFGEQVGGWKVGATHPNSQAALGTSGPVAARLFSQSLYHCPDGASVDLRDGLVVRGLEAEYAFLLGADLGPRETPYTRDEVLAAVASVHPSIEVVDTRFTQMQGGALVIADNVGDSSWIYADGSSDVAGLDIINAEVTMEVNAETVVVGNGGEVLGDPLASLLWLANDHARQREGLRAGQFITAGSCTGLYKGPAGCSAKASFAGLGEVRIQFDAS